MVFHSIHCVTDPPRARIISLPGTVEGGHIDVTGQYNPETPRTSEEEWSGFPTWEPEASGFPSTDGEQEWSGFPTIEPEASEFSTTEKEPPRPPLPFEEI